MRIKRGLVLAAGCLVLTVVSSVTAQQPPTVSKSFDFRNGLLEWQAGFADYPPATNGNGFYELLAELRTLPAGLNNPGTAFYIQGDNHSDDLFMFLKRRLTAADGLVAGQAYEAHFTIIFASIAPSGCAGIGGSPGGGVFLKAGASLAEPLALPGALGTLRMNVDIGVQANSGIATSIAGTIGNGQPCGSGTPSFVTLEKTHQHTSLVTAGNNGDLWLLVGTDSGFEGLTSLYYQRIDVSLVPVRASPPPTLFTNKVTGRAAGFDSVTLKSEPFSVLSASGFAADGHNRLVLFAYDLELKAGEDVSAITVHAEDAQHVTYTLPVETVSEVPNFSWIKQITFKLPAEFQHIGDIWVSVSLRGASSNKALLRIN